jgi:phosphoribosyl 1,2-cyclic phosphodiesterase
MEARLDLARLPPGAIDHVLVTHGHLDHARSAGSIARRERATLHCPEPIMRHRAARSARRMSALPFHRPFEVESRRGGEFVRVLAVELPHDCQPTAAFRIEHEGRVAVIVTDMGQPREEVARALCGAHVLVLEFNYDPALMASGPYSPVLQRRITGSRGHLSNAEAACMLEWLAGPELHTLVLAHVSQKTNRPEIAFESARAALDRVGLGSVRVLVADQHAPGEILDV